MRAYIVLRTDLSISLGKTLVQIGHGVDMIHLSAQGRLHEAVLVEGVEAVSDWGAGDSYARWLAEGARRKIILAARDLKDLEAIASMLRDRRLAFAFIKDAGLTEVAPGTITGLVALPMSEEDTPGRIRHLPLWKG